MLNAYDPQTARRLLGWWGGLERDKGTRARLRRCRRPHDAVVSVPAFHQLLQLVAGDSTLTFRERQGLAGWAAIAAHVKDHVKSERVGESFRKNELTESRFLRLLDSRELDRFCTELRTCIAATGQRVNVVDLADILLRWPQERLKERIALDFWRAATPETTFTERND